MLTKGNDESSIITHERYGVVVSFWVDGWSTQHIGPLPQQKRSYPPAYPSQTTTPTENKKTKTKKNKKKKRRRCCVRVSFLSCGMGWVGGGVGR
jgi:hypothetical protein